MASSLDTIDNLSVKARLEYSRMKLGCADAISSFAARTCDSLQTSSSSFATRDGGLVVACPGTAPEEVPNSITYVTRLVAQELGAIHCALLKEDALGHSHADASQFNRDVFRTIRIADKMPVLLHNRPVILVDDCIVGGATLSKSRMALAPHTHTIATFVLVDLRGHPPEIEGELNRTVISAEGPQALAKLWSEARNFSTSKLVCYTHEVGPETIVGDLSIHGALNLYFASLLYFRGYLPARSDSVIASLRAMGTQVPSRREMTTAWSCNGREQVRRRHAMLGWLHETMSCYAGFRVPDHHAADTAQNFWNILEALAGMQAV